MKKLLPLCLVLLCPGCVGLAGVVRALAKDPSTAYIKVVNPVYGSFEYLRVGSTNSASVDVGKVTVNAGK